MISSIHVSILFKVWTWSELMLGCSRTSQLIVRGVNPSSELATRAKASAYWFCDLEKCCMLNEENLLMISQVLLGYTLMFSSLASHSPETCLTIS